MATTLPPPVHSSRPRPVAPMWHTVVLAGLFLLLALGGARLQHRAAAHGPDLPAAQNPTVLYLSLIAMQWGLVYFVWKAGLRRQGVTLREVIGGRWTNARDVAVDLGLALGVWGLWTGISYGAEHWLGATSPGSDGAGSERTLTTGTDTGTSDVPKVPTVSPSRSTATRKYSTAGSNTSVHGMRYVKPSSVSLRSLLESRRVY